MPKYSYMPQELQNALVYKLKVGDSARIAHEYKWNGQPCSVNKDPCMAVHRTVQGLRFFCYRCKCGGQILTDSLSPEQTKAVLASIREGKEEKPEKEERVKDNKLPLDFIPFRSDRPPGISISLHAIQWLQVLGYPVTVTHQDMVTLHYGWSPLQERAIFPVYSEPFQVKDGVFSIESAPENKIIGWVGRHMPLHAPQEGDEVQPKYRTIKNADISRLYYTIEGNKEGVVFVEDILSAIKVAKATSMTVVALLTSTLSLFMAKKYKDQQQYLWLDDDKKIYSIKRANLLNSRGVKIKSIRTYHDPKVYDLDEIRAYLGKDREDV